MENFYVTKMQRLVAMQGQLAAFRKELEALAKAECDVPVGDEPLDDISDALSFLEDAVDGLAIAVEPLASAQSRVQTSV